MSHEPQYKGIPPTPPHDPIAATPPTIQEMADLFMQFAAAERHVLWVIDLQPLERVSFVSPAFEAVWGRPVQGMYDDPRLWAQCIHDDDRAAVVESFGRWLADPDHASYDVEYRVVRPDGSVRWIHDVGHVGGRARRPLTRVNGIAEDITERKQAQLALLAEQKRITAIAEVAPSVLCTFRRAADGSITFPFGSARVEQLYGLPTGTVARDATQVIQNIHPDDVDEVRSSINASALEGRPWRAEFRMVRADGSEQWIEGHSRPVPEPDGGTLWHGTVADISERKRTEQALLDSRARLAAVFEHMTEGVMLCSPDGHLAGFNAAALAMHDMTADTANGLTTDQVRTMYELRHLDGTLLRNSQWPLTRVMRGETLRQHELRIHHREQGWHKVFAYSGARVDDESGRPLFGVLQCADVTGRRAIEDEVERMNAELERRVADRTAELQAAVKELEAFSYSVSHDLRAPLRALDGFSQALIEDHGAALPADGQRYLGIIRDTAQKMGQLIDDLLEFARLGRQPLTRRPVDVGQLARHAYDSLAPQCQGRRIELSIGELPPCDADPALLRQVWVNLLGNAVKYTRQREVAVIEVGHGLQGDVVEYFVRDNGAGFDMRYVHKLFGVFERLHRADEFEGTGVGLAIVQRIVQRHGGHVRAHGEPGRGSSFHFTLG
ncbi:PAS domain-containing protein [Variovorax sp. YR752]|uniref:PAS domain-containing sensor histidine kinase n=1 Tax=Variovorax sp. YR752 TaxID=1884383 RepID=UPI0031383334